MQSRIFGHAALERHVDFLSQRSDDLFEAGQDQWEVAKDMLWQNGHDSALYLKAKAQAKRLSDDLNGATNAHRVALKYEMELWECEVLHERVPLAKPPYWHCPPDCAAPAVECSGCGVLSLVQHLRGGRCPGCRGRA